ncbi:MAG TPA: MFS transporter [Candidatus Acidoferrales bacterium]|nr:MFS transporter [Candidatus Acidoferrales bacterium]
MNEAQPDSDDRERWARLKLWASLRHRDFALHIGVVFFTITAHWMRQAENLYQVYELSASTFQLGLTGLAQAVPMFAFGVFGGTLADLMDRRRLIELAILGNFLIAAVLGIVTITGDVQVWHILIGTALTSMLNVVLTPARMAMIARLVPSSHLMNAVSLNSSVSQAGHIIGPSLAGLAIAWTGAGPAYLLNALLYLPAAAGMIALRTSGAPSRPREAVSLESVLAGIRFMRRERVILAFSLMDFAIIGVGYYQSLLPVFAKDIYQVGPAAFGLLASAPAAGGIIGILSLLLAGDVKRKGLVALWAFLSFSSLLAVFAVNRHFWLALPLVMALGVTNSLQAVIRQTAFQVLTPDHLRGRTFAVFAIFAQGAGSFGAMQVGFVASLIGAPGALLLGSAVGIVLTLSFWIGWPEVRRFGAPRA